MTLFRSLKDPSITPSTTTIGFIGNVASRMFEVNDVKYVVEKASTNAESVNFLQDELNVLLQRD